MHYLEQIPAVRLGRLLLRPGGEESGMVQIGVIPMYIGITPGGRFLNHAKNHVPTPCIAAAAVV